MKKLTNYLLESFDRYYKLSESDKKLLLDLDLQYHKLMEQFCEEQTHYMNVSNTGDEIKRIIKCYKENEEFELNIEYEKSKFDDKKWCEELSGKFNELRNEFNNLDCFLSKYYIENIEEKIYSLEYFYKYSKNNKIKSKYITLPPKGVYEDAIDILKKNKYEEVDNMSDEYKHKISPEESQKRLQKIIDDKGFGWKVNICDNMIPRMSVRPYKEFRISSNCNFSEVDLESLRVHEIEVHTARKYWGLQTGLYLFLYGLNTNNTYDEGIAIYNSLHKLKNPKPNILFFIAIKIVMMYNLDKMSPLEIFKFVKKLTNAPDNVIALSLIRINRVSNNNLMFTNYANSDSIDMDYLKGYTMVKDMTENERQELIKYSIGPKQLFELDNIKKFLKINKFEPIDYKK